MNNNKLEIHFSKKIYNTTGNSSEPHTQLFDLECLTSQSITWSMLVEFLQEIIKQHTSLSVIDFKPLQMHNAVLNYQKQNAPANKRHSGRENKSVYIFPAILTFDQSKPAWTAPEACRSCSPKPAKECRLVMVCSTDHEVHFWRY